MKNVNKILLSAMIIPMLLSPIKAFAAGTTTSYTVKSGDSLWKIATTNNVTVDYLKILNKLTTNNINIGQVIKLLPETTTYTVKQGDTLYLIAQKYGITIDAIKNINHLTGTMLLVSQKLLIPLTVVQPKNDSSTSQNPSPVKDFPSITYVIKAGDTATSISKIFNVSASDIMKYNYMNENDWFSEGQKIAINGYAPRDYAVTPGMDKAATQYGKAVDWFRDGQYLLKRNDVFTIIDYATRKQLSVKVLGGFQHADVEPVTSTDTSVMKSLFTNWDWTPRPVVIFKDGMNIAGSISGMPHSFDTTPNNGVNGHFDLYLKNSLPHSGSTSQIYVQQHYKNITISSGQK